MYRFHVRSIGTGAQAVGLALILGISGCASGSGGGGASSNMITQQQIDGFNGEDAYQLVQRYKSRWLRPARNQNSLTAQTAGSVVPGGDQDALPGQEIYAQVFRDGVFYGNLESLRSLDPREIASVEYISATDATTRYGTGYSGGIIELHTRAAR
jgi:hypothetical protein